MRILKTIFFFSIFWLYGIPSVFSQGASFTDQINNLWMSGLGGVRQVKNISDARLEKNSQDIVGLVLRLEHAFLYQNFNTIENTKNELVLAIHNSGSRKLIERLSFFEKQVELGVKSKDIFPPELFEAAMHRLNSGYDGKLPPLIFQYLLKLCEEKGLVSIADLEERGYEKYYWATIPVVLLMIGFAVYLRRRGQKVEDASA